jgi:hypothetical protein
LPINGRPLRVTNGGKIKGSTPAVRVAREFAARPGLRQAEISELSLGELQELSAKLQAAELPALPAPADEAVTVEFTEVPAESPLQ